MRNKRSSMSATGPFPELRPTGQPAIVAPSRSLCSITRLDAKFRNVTECGNVRKFRTKSSEREENAWVLGWYATFHVKISFISM